GRVVPHIFEGMVRHVGCSGGSSSTDISQCRLASITSVSTLVFQLGTACLGWAWGSRPPCSRCISTAVASWPDSRRA
ncbi:hypothetical protein PIB30_115845, partial [Stylosanthes scabra]|nr:hypothetical protein [Stylosanthes scabra]